MNKRRFAVMSLLQYLSKICLAYVHYFVKELETINELDIQVFNLMIMICIRLHN